MTTETERMHVAELAAVKAEIHAYPRPIAGCDAQFNHLLDRRSELLKLVDGNHDDGAA
ncbi:MAG: hypothetical protein AAF317_06550 [Pseudomonadota bacterium]